jgi:hypothetical protein
MNKTVAVLAAVIDILLAADAWLIMSSPPAGAGPPLPDFTEYISSGSLYHVTPGAVTIIGGDDGS